MFDLEISLISSSQRPQFTMDNTAENRMQSYRDFLRRKTEKQRLYRAKLKAEAQVLGIPKRKYVRRTTKVQGNVIIVATEQEEIISSLRFQVSANVQK